MSLLIYTIAPLGFAASHVRVGATCALLTKNFDIYHRGRSSGEMSHTLGDPCWKAAGKKKKKKKGPEDGREIA